MDNPRPPSASAPALHALTPQALDGVDESTWVDVIHKMDEVYQQLVADEIALEAKNTELEQQQQFIFSLLSAMSDVLLACDAHGVIEETNAALCELVGRPEAELRGCRIDSLMADPGSVERLHSVMETVAARHGATVEVELRDAQGQPMPVEFNCTPRLNPGGRRVGHVFVGRPLGELKRAYHQLREAHEALQRTQQQLLHSEKMASLGRLVAGVAHELNNPISFVLGNVHALARYTKRLEQYVGAVHAELPARELADMRQRLRIDHTLGDLDSLMQGTLEGAQRTADIVAGLKRFSAVDRQELAPVEIRAVVEQSIHWVCKGTAPAFEVSFAPGAPAWVNGNQGQLLQVFMNLVQNAYDAASAAGRLPPHLDIALHRTAPDRLALVFADNGPGIPADKLDRIFEPFFTTKPIGKGTGLGLSISYGIVDRHGGRITAGAAHGGGAQFVVDLPTCPAPAPGDRAGDPPRP